MRGAEGAEEQGAEDEDGGGVWGGDVHYPVGVGFGEELCPFSRICFKFTLISLILQNFLRIKAI